MGNFPVNLRGSEEAMSDYSTHNDQELIKLLKAEDHIAFNEIYKRYWKKLFTIAANKLDDLSEAEDIVQQLFVSIWERRNELEIASSLSSYLAVAVKYRIFKSLAKQSRISHFSDEQAAQTVFEIEDNSTQNWLEFQEVRSRLNQLVATLPEKCRLVYQLSKEQGYSQKQVAEKLDISERTVQAHMSRAYKTLKTGLKNFFISL